MVENEQEEVQEEITPSSQEEASPAVEATENISDEQVEETENKLARSYKGPPQPTNFESLRAQKETAEYERDQLLRKLQQIEQEKQPKEEPEVSTVAPDDFVEGKHLNKYDKKIRELEQQLKTHTQQTTATAVEAKIQAQYPDFDTVVTRDNLELLSAAHPEIAQTINTSSDLYSKAVSAYKVIKNLGIAPKKTYTNEKNKAQENAAKPRPLASVGGQQGDTPLTKANAFAEGLTPELKKQLLKEMMESRR